MNENIAATETSVRREAPLDWHPLDVHAHMVVPEAEALVQNHPDRKDADQRYLQRMGEKSAEVTVEMMKSRYSRLTSVERQLADMDENGIAAQLISSPTQFHYWADRELAREIFRSVHDGIAKYCAAAPTRMTGLGQVPLQHPDLCVEALEDAVLRAGLKGVIISSHAELSEGEGTVELSDRRLDDFWRRCVELGAIVFLHPLGCPLGARLDEWYLANSVGQPLEHAVAISHMIFSGVFDRHPGLRFLAAHGGGYLPTHMGRADHAWKHRADSRTCERLPSSYLSDIFVDTCVHSPEVLRELVRTMGSERVLLGSDRPFDMGSDTPVSDLLQAGLDEESARAIAEMNARALGIHPTPSSHAA